MVAERWNITVSPWMPSCFSESLSTFHRAEGACETYTVYTHSYLASMLSSGEVGSNMPSYPSMRPGSSSHAVSLVTILCCGTQLVVIALAGGSWRVSYCEGQIIWTLQCKDLKSLVLVGATNTIHLTDIRDILISYLKYFYCIPTFLVIPCLVLNCFVWYIVIVIIH